jgi:hypothetical protein
VQPIGWALSQCARRSLEASEDVIKAAKAVPAALALAIAALFPAHRPRVQRGK